MMREKNITVVVPTYNRAHLIVKTIPTYLQSDRVSEIIVVNDCSLDNTIEVIMQLQQQYPQVRLINLEHNSKQTVAKNVGMQAVNTEYIFFGDDDSFVMPHAIDQLYDSLIKYNADIASARALYLKTQDDLDNLEAFLATENAKEARLLNFAHMELNFHVNTNRIIEVPLCHAYFLIKKDNALKVRFDEKFTGNCFREETDFTLRASGLGMKIIYNPFVPQFNYPRNIATGGASGIPKLKYAISSIRYNWYFLHKDVALFRSLLMVNDSVYILQARFVFKLIKQAIHVMWRGLTTTSHK